MIDSSPREPRTKLLRALLLIALVVQSTWMLNVYPHWKDTNSSSRVYLTLAIIEQGTFRIDSCLTKYGDTLDKAAYGGHFYTDKAPGTSFWFVPVAWLLQSLGVASLRVLFYGLRLLCISLPTVGFWWFVLPWFREWSGREDRAIALVAAGALGTNFLIFSTQLFAHVPAGCLLFLAFLSARRLGVEPASARTRLGPALLSGALAGTAFLNDYVVMLAVAVLGIAIGFFPRLNWRQPLAFGLGLAPALAVWMLYNWICFDHPLRTGFYYHAVELYGNAYRSGFLGMQRVDASAVMGMLFSPARGLLFLSPFLVLAPIGWWRQIRESSHRKDAIVALLMFVALFLFAMTTIDWRGGWGMGPRYLVPAVPFLLAGVAGAVRNATATEASSIALAGLATVGILLGGLAAATVPLVPQDCVNPLYALDWKLASRGYVGPQLLAAPVGSVIALVPYGASMLLACALVLTAGPVAGLRGRMASVALSLALAAGVVAWQASLPQSPDEQFACELTRIDTLCSLGYFDESAREMSQLLVRQSSAGEAATDQEASP